jgi:hypothetical protein
MEVRLPRRRRTSKKTTQAEVWQHLAEDLGGELLRDKRGRPTGARVVFGYWSIVFDQHTVHTGHSQHTSTRARAWFGAMDDFRFRIYRKNVMTRFGEWLGRRGTPTGHVMLDRDFLLRSNSEPKVRSLMLRTRVADGIARQPSGSFEILPLSRGERKKQPPGTRQLIFQTSGTITDVERLVAIAALFRETLDQLYRMGLITDRETRTVE